MHSDKCFSGAWATVWTKWDGLPCGFWQGKLQLILWLETWVQKVEKHWAVNQSQSAGLSELRKSRRGRGGLFPFAYRIHKTSLFLVSSACSVCRCRATVMLVHVMELQNDDFLTNFPSLHAGWYRSIISKITLSSGAGRCAPIWILTRTSECQSALEQNKEICLLSNKQHAQKWKM